MCGINGIYGLSDRFKQESIIRTMNKCLAHRGPDDEGFFSDDKIVLGHKRLSIIDLSNAGHQPMFSNDKRYCIIHNGEIYNFKEIRNQIKDYIFKTQSDTEVILASYTKWGSECVKYFNGMFAFAVWDNMKRELFIARDRFGIKPLYYYGKNDLLLFSSEIRSLLSSGIVLKKVDENSLIDYLRYQTVHASKTILKEVFMLMPGHSMTVKENQVSIECYWKPEAAIENSDSYLQICKSVNELLTASVERRLVADVPFGAFLSGGIDSSSIVGLMSKVSTQKVKTFSVVFDEKKFSESEFSKFIAKKYNTDHHEIKLNVSDFVNELPNALNAMDHPSGDGPNTYVVSKATKNAGITMALSGLGGDELFAGYDIFKRSLKLKNSSIRKISQPIRMAAGNFLHSVKKDSGSKKLSKILAGEKMSFNEFYPLSRQVLMDDVIEKITSKSHLPENIVSTIISAFDVNENEFLLSKVSIAEISSYMENVLLRDTDQMSMAHALEVRVPFLDYELVKYVLSVPDKFKNPVTPKKLLVDSLDNLLPPKIVNRKKMGFTLPWTHWMKNELQSMCEQNLLSLSRRKYFHEKELQKLWARFLSGDKEITWSRIWHLVVLEHWLSKNEIDD
ncbi:MAG: asparagine synthase (glutamine-hydrolyzing) [Bacteroidetes bacterium]|nr:asparagine synthase (glutamine-hydrolyzing) [Bacteroidota bacterium]